MRAALGCSTSIVSGAQSGRGGIRCAPSNGPRGYRSQPTTGSTASALSVQEVYVTRPHCPQWTVWGARREYQRYCGGMSAAARAVRSHRGPRRYLPIVLGLALLAAALGAGQGHPRASDTAGSLAPDRSTSVICAPVDLQPVAA